MRVALALVAGVLVTLLLATHISDTLELPARDVALRVLPERPATSTVVVAIDERSLQARGAWPWARADLAKIVDACAAAGARAVVFDILLSDPRAGDALLAASMRRLPGAAVSVLIENEQWRSPAPKLREATIVAHGNFELDHDGILRRLRHQAERRPRATGVSIEAGRSAPTRRPVGLSISPGFRTPPRRLPQISAADLAHGVSLDNRSSSSAPPPSASATAS